MLNRDCSSNKSLNKLAHIYHILEYQEKCWQIAQIMQILLTIQFSYTRCSLVVDILADCLIRQNKFAVKFPIYSKLKDYYNLNQIKINRLLYVHMTMGVLYSKINALIFICVV